MPLKPFGSTTLEGRWVPPLFHVLSDGWRRGHWMGGMFGDGVRLCLGISRISCA